MIEQLVHIFECLTALVEEARVLVARDLVFQDVRVVGCSEGHLDSALLWIVQPVVRLHVFLHCHLIMLL